MSLIVILLALVSIGELALWLPPLWRFRALVATCLLIALGLISIVLIIASPRLWTALMAVFSLYRMLNLRRVIKGRTQADYLYNAAWRTSLWLIAFQMMVGALTVLGGVIHLNGWGGLYSLAVLQLGAALGLCLTTFRNIARTVAPTLGQAYAERDLPTLTVALPARNETNDLEACLQSLVANDYPKLEIIVLDDCSQNKRTPEIIRSFAHDGVKFVGGAVPPEHWLAKNYAYQQLTEAANGELLLFCGVDTRFEPQSLRTMVETLLQTKKAMLSFIPRNQAPSSKGLMVQPARYAWELALPRSQARPPVLSTCWLITAEALHGAGGFKAVSRGHSPESYFARAASRRQGYGFLQSSPALGLTSAKSFAEQRATAIRTRYPQLHRRPELVGLVSLSELGLLLASFVLLIVGLADRHWALAGLSVLSCLLLCIFYNRIVTLTYRQFLARGLWALPLAALYDIGLLNYSMWLYEFREVIWKGRNICIPLMHVVPDLPQPGSAQKP